MRPKPSDSYLDYLKKDVQKQLDKGILNPKQAKKEIDNAIHKTYIPVWSDRIKGKITGFRNF